MAAVCSLLIADLVVLLVVANKEVPTYLGARRR